MGVSFNMNTVLAGIMIFISIAPAPNNGKKIKHYIVKTQGRNKSEKLHLLKTIKETDKEGHSKKGNNDYKQQDEKNWIRKIKERNHDDKKDSGNWGSWTSWTLNSSTGLKKRNRSCNCGQRCIGPSTDVRTIPDAVNTNFYLKMEKKGLSKINLLKQMIMTGKEGSFKKQSIKANDYEIKEKHDYQECDVNDVNSCPKRSETCDHGRCECNHGYGRKGNHCRCIMKYIINDNAYQKVLGRKICKRCLQGQELVNTKTDDFCKDEMSVCSQPEKDKKHNPNINRVSLGYNILLGNLFGKMTDTDKGITAAPVFAPFSQSDYHDDCEMKGYYRPDNTKSCSGGLIHKIYSNAKEVKETFVKNIETDNEYQEVTMEVTKGSNAAYTNSVSFGEEITLNSGNNRCSNTNHCVDKSVADSVEIGETMENNGHESITDQISNTVEQSNTDEHTNQGGGSLSVTVGATTEAGFLFGKASGSMESTVEGHFDHTSRDSETNTNTDSLTKSFTSELGWSQGKTQSTGKTTTINTNICGSEEKCETEDKSTDKTKQKDDSSTKEKNHSVTYKLPGYENSISNTKEYLEATNFLEKKSGSIAVSSIECTKYKIIINKDDLPAFSPEMKKRLRHLHEVSQSRQNFRLIVTKTGKTKFETKMNVTTEQTFDEEFSKFISIFGTHIFSEIKMGGKMMLKTNIRKQENEDGSQKDKEDCIEKIQQELIEKQATDKKSDHACKNDEYKKSLKSSFETKDRSFSSIGGHLGSLEKLSDWSKQEFDSPAIIDFKLLPIISIFSKKAMTEERVSSKNGGPINYPSILRWFLPRYLVLINRCMSLSNHIISQEGNGCIPCKANSQPSEDRLTCELCTTIPNHINSPEGNGCIPCKANSQPSEDRL